MVIVAFFAVADFVDFDVVVVVVVNVSNGSKTVVAQWLPNIGKLANKLLPLLQLLIHLLPRQQGYHGHQGHPDHPAHHCHHGHHGHQGPTGSFLFNFRRVRVGY